MDCRLGCGACCIAPSIASSIPGMKNGKPAGVRCVQLGDDNLCRLFGLPERPTVCIAFKPETNVCGDTSVQALHLIGELEKATLP